MANLPIDTTRIDIKSGGTCDEVPDWSTRDENGRPTGQLHDDVTGFPVWSVKVLAIIDGAVEEWAVRVPAREKLELSALSDITLTGLTVNVSRQGRRYFNAESITTSGTKTASAIPTSPKRGDA